MDLHVGTLSKAFGCMGGFVACSRQWKDLLVNRGRSQVSVACNELSVMAQYWVCLGNLEDPALLAVLYSLRS